MSGFGTEIGGAVAFGAVEALNTNDEDRLILRPFPQQVPPGESKEEFWKKYRTDMIASSGFCIYLCGNKTDPGTNSTVVADGVLQEFEIAKSLDKYPIPIGASGHAAKQIWDEVRKSLNTYYPKDAVAIKKDIEMLGNASKSDDDILKAVFSIIKQVSSH